MSAWLAVFFSGMLDISPFVVYGVYIVQCLQVPRDEGSGLLKHSTVIKGCSYGQDLEDIVWALETEYLGSNS